MNDHERSLEEAIRIEAYLLSEQAGHPHGMEGIFWAKAGAIVRERATQAPSIPEKAPVKRRAKKAAGTTGEKTKKREAAKSPAEIVKKIAAPAMPKSEAAKADRAIPVRGGTVAAKTPGGARPSKSPAAEALKGRGSAAKGSKAGNATVPFAKSSEAKAGSLNAA